MATPKVHTKDRLLDAGEKLFGEREFQEVSIRDLAAAADVNVAAVNYHFQDKENLYREVLRRRFTVHRDRALENLEAALDRNGEKPELASIIRSFVSTYLEGALIEDRGASFMALFTRQLHHGQVPDSPEFFKVMVAPVFSAVAAALLESRPHLEADQIKWAIASVVGQVHHFIMRRMKYVQLEPGCETRAFMENAFPVLTAGAREYVAETTDHITRFSTAAIDGMFPEESS